VIVSEKSLPLFCVKLEIWEAMSMSKRILVVDDEESSAFLLSENLAELGPEYRVETACSSEEALQKIAAEPFDLVITDLRMPGVDGLELLERVRAAHPQTWVILTTAYGSEEVEARAHSLGVYRYMAKPFLIEDLLDAVREALEGTARADTGK
jgi:two-component system response regulator PilR (NtrC family)